MTTKPPATSLLHDLRSLPGQYWILFGGTLVNRFGHFVIPFLTIYLSQRGHPAGVIGLILAMYGAGSLVAGFIGGYLADRIGRKPTMLISCGGAAVLMLMLSQAASPNSLMVLTLLTGLFTGMYSPAAGALIADLVPPALRIRAFSCQRLAINLGFAAGMAMAGFMARQSFMALFVIDAATTLILGLTVYFGLKPRAVPARERSGWSHALHHMRGNIPFQHAVAASLLIGIVFWQMSSSFSLQTTEGAGLDERSYGLLMALNGILIVLLELPLTGFTRRFSPVVAMAVGYTLIGVGMGLNAFGASLTLLLVSMTVFTFGEMIALPVTGSYLADLAPDEMRGRYQGVMSINWSLGTMLGPWLGMSLYHFSPPVLWIGMLAISCLAAVLILAGERRRAVRLPAPALPHRDAA